MSFKCFIINEEYNSEEELLNISYPSVFLGEEPTLEKAKALVEKIFSDFNYIEHHNLTSYFFTMNLQIKVIDNYKNKVSAIALSPGATQALCWTQNNPFHKEQGVAH